MSGMPSAGAVAIPSSVLVVQPNRLGDVLLTTALVRSLRAAWPAAMIDLLVFEGTEHVVDGNADVRRVLAMPVRESAMGTLRRLAALWRRYDIAIAARASDRALLHAWAAGRMRVGVVTGSQRLQRLLLNRSLIEGAGTYRIDSLLALAGLLGVESRRMVVPPTATPAGSAAIAGILGFDPAREAFAVVHPAPMYAYKAWTREGWQEVIAHLRARGLRVVVTGASATEVEAAAGELNANGDRGMVNAAGRLSFGQLAGILELARVYVGPDTSVTHLAAACETPTVALFGPTDPRQWGPLSAAAAGSSAPPYSTRESVQHRGNVWLMQNLDLACVPCHREGCERRLDSRSRCLDELPAARVAGVIDQALGHETVIRTGSEPVTQLH